MAKYVSFNFSDGECEHYPIIVRINSDITTEQLKELKKVTFKLMERYIEEGDYWDTDEILVENAIQEFVNKYDLMDFSYEIVGIDFNIDTTEEYS